MKKKLLLLSCLSSIVFASNLHAHEQKTGFYVNVPVGYSFVSKPKTGVTYSDAKLKNATIFGIGAGYDFDVVRAELNLTFRNKYKFTNNDIATSLNSTRSFLPFNIKATTLMLDLYKDFAIGSDLTPFVFAGIGYSKISTGDYNYQSTSTISYAVTTLNTVAGKSSNSFAWRLGFGGSYKINQIVSLNLSYSYTHVGSVSRVNPKTAVNDKIKINANEIIAGVRFSL